MASIFHKSFIFLLTGINGWCRREVSPSTVRRAVVPHSNTGYMRKHFSARLDPLVSGQFGAQFGVGQFGAGYNLLYNN